MKETTRTTITGKWKAWFEAYAKDDAVSMETRGDIAYQRGYEAGRRSALRAAKKGKVKK